MSPTSPSSDPQPRQIGPYRLEDRLGRGGMGEVYRGYDARLDRPVALKRVRPGLGNQEVALRRFQREARAAARLRHPAIVQVHDWVEAEDGGAWLVMELVEGRSLRGILHGGPLAPARAVALARDLLEGLAVAHEAGLVHRDLKAENIMVSSVSSAGRGRGEQAKILDFGLAKQAVPEANETQLSEEGKIVGTLSALAPEQVLGQPVDHRADLFALGSLLYEALAGAPAFVGSNAGETLNRICTARQVPLRTLRPEISLSLSTFVDRLLEKDPRRRPATADEALDLLDRVSTDSLDTGLATLDNEGLPTEVDVPSSSISTPNATSGVGLPRREASSGRLWMVIVALAIVAGLGWLGLRRAGSPEPAEPIYVTVPETVVVAADERDLRLAASTVHTALFRGLVGIRGIVALEVPPADVETTDVEALALSTAANEVLLSSLECTSSGCRVELRRVGGLDGRILGAQAFTIDPRQLFDVDRAVVGHLQRVYGGLELKATVSDLDVDPQDYAAYVELRERFERRDEGLSASKVLEELAQLLDRSPGFVDLYVFEAQVALQRFQEERDSAYLRRARAAIQQARSIAPDDLRVLARAAWIFRLAGDLDEAERVLDDLRRLDPGNPMHLLQQALLYEARGEIDVALSMGRQAVERLPSANMYQDIADLLLRHGEIEEARSALEQSLEKRPNHFDGVSRLAQLELTVGSPERAVELYLGLVERSAEPTELTNLGTAYMLLGDYDLSAATFRRAMEASPTPFASLNLADVEKLRGHEEEADRLYERVLEQVSGGSSADRLASLRAQALSHLGRSEEAVDAIQSALTQRPDHPWTAYEAALVYVLIGERSSAVWNARRALDGGVEPRWFSLPWFDPIRDQLSQAKDRRDG